MLTAIHALTEANSVAARRIMYMVRLASTLGDCSNVGNAVLDMLPSYPVAKIDPPSPLSLI